MTNWAIVIGIDNYNNLDNLKYATDDAECMERVLKELNFEEVFLFTKDSPAIQAHPAAISTRPTFTTLLNFLDRQFKTSTPLLRKGDNLWFFFAGHGQRYNDTDYLMLSDSNPSDPERTAISVDVVTKQLQKCGADDIVLFLDSCRNENNGGRSGSRGQGVSVEPYPGVIIFYSCKPTQRSWEIDTPINKGAFTHILVQALSGQTTPRCATVRQLDQYLCEQVPILNSTYNKSEQTPKLAINSDIKKSLILIPRFAEKEDIEQLKKQALLAEVRGDWEQAWDLWMRVNRVTLGQDQETAAALTRIRKRESANFMNLIISRLRKTARFLLQNWKISLCIAVLLFAFVVYFYWRETEVNIQSEEFVSYGEKSLFDPNYFQISNDPRAEKIRKEYYERKDEGMKRFQNKEFREASEILSDIRKDAEKIWQDNKNRETSEKAAALAVLKDPEILIFANNAKLRNDIGLSSPLATVAAVIPAKEPPGQHFLFGIAQAQSEAIESNIKLQVVIADDNNSSNQAKLIARRLSKDVDVFGVVGHYLSLTMCDTLPIYSRGKLTVVSPASKTFGLRKKCGGDPNKVFFRTASSTQSEAESLGSYLQKYGEPNKRNVVVFSTSDLYSRSVSNEFQSFWRSNKGGKITASDLLTESPINFSSKIKDAGAIATFPDGRNLLAFDRAIQIIRQYGKDKVLLAGNTLYFAKALAQLDNQGIPEGKLMIAVDWHPEQTGAGTFVKESEKYWHANVNFRTALSYESTNILAKVLQQVPLGENIRLSVNKALASITSQAPVKSKVLDSTNVSFDGDGNRVEKTNVCVTPSKDTSGDRTSDPKFTVCR